MSISLAPVSQVLFQDNFNAPLDPNVWSYNLYIAPPGNNSSFNGRTQMEQYLPVVSDGALQLTVQTYNPTGFSFLGSEIISNQTFSDSSGGIAFTAVARAVSVVPGLVGGIFAYNFNNSTGLHDEIDFETLTNIAASENNQEQTNVYSNEPLGAGNPQFVTDLDLTAYHTYTMEWFPNAVLWFIDGQLVREITGNIPQGPLAFHLNFYAPAMDWAEAYSSGLQPTNNPQNNVTYTFEVDSATVSEIENSTFPRTIVAGPGVFTLTLTAAPLVLGLMGSDWTAFGSCDL
jgi:beta-glucanase (GH16 family)